MITFNKHLLEFYQFIQQYSFDLPKDIKAIQTYEGVVFENLSKFFKQYYNDANSRNLILGINPGRKGAGVTGIPFTDSERLNQILGIKGDKGKKSYEPSADFFYKAIHSYGGAKEFYNDFLVSSVSPVGFLKLNKRENWVNYNYYDDAELKSICQAFIIESMDRILELPINRKKVLCLGSGKNYKELLQLNEQHNWFESIIPIEHPRYIIQYKRKDIDAYKLKYVSALTEIKKSQLDS